MPSPDFRCRLRRLAIAIVTACALTVAGSLVLPSTAQAADTQWTISSPDGAIAAQVNLDSGQLSLTASRDDKTVLSVNAIGVLTSVADLSVGLSVLSSEQSAINDSYTMVTGKSHRREVKQNQLVLNVQAPTTVFKVVIRAANDGIAYRIELPGFGSYATDYTVTDETATFTLPNSNATAWLQPFAVNYENDHEVSTVAGNVSGTIAYPALFRTSTDADSHYVFLTESSVDGNYAATHLTHAAGSPTYGTELGNPQSGTRVPPVTARGALNTAWRVAIVGDLGHIVDSTLVDDLAEPSELVDTDISWIKPGTSAWSWNMNRGHGPQGNLSLHKSFVDFAAEQGWPYYVIDEGWKSEWVDELVRYANAKGVEIIAWFHSRDLQTAKQRQDWFTQLTDWGVAGIKVDFMDSDSQQTFKWYDDILRETADAKLMINFHGSTLPKGWQRTWPQLMTYEGVRGEENGRSSQRNTILPFTRNVVGSMDYTPVVFTDNYETTQAHELALPILYESGWTHYADNPSAYTSRPIAQRFLQQFGSVWDDTKFLSGTPGTNVTMARRSGDNWFVGGITSGSQGNQTVSLSFLGAGEWLMHRIIDSGPALNESISTATASETLSIPTSNNGGFVLMLCPATPGLTSCYQDVAQVPTTTVSDVTVSHSQVTTGDEITLDATFTLQSGGPVTDLVFAPDIPTTWQLIEGSPVIRDTVAVGESISGTWTLRVGSGGVRGDIALNAAARFTSPAGQRIRSAGPANVSVSANPLVGSVYLSDIDFASVETQWGAVTRDVDFFGNPLNMLGPDGVDTVYEKGIEVNSIATIKINLNNQCQAFTATVGLEQSDSDHPEEHRGSIDFEIRDQSGNVLAQSPSTIRWDSPAVPVNVPLTGVTELVLYAGNGGDSNDSDHVVFADAQLQCQPQGGDTTKPTVEVRTSAAKPMTAGWYTTPATATIKAYDDDINLTVEYSTNDGVTWTPYIAPITFSDGAHSLSVRATDSTGNVSTPARSLINVDLDAPTVTAVVSESARTVTLAATDTGSGVEATEYRVNNGPWTLYTAPVEVGNTATTISYRAQDRVGHVSETQTVTVPAVVVRPDSVKTTTSATVAPKVAFGSRAEFTVSVTAADGRAVTGTVTVRNGAQEVARGTLQAGVVKLALPKKLAVGRHSLVVSYNGTGQLLSSVVAVQVTVTKAKSQIKLKTKPKKKKVTTSKRAQLTVRVKTNTKVKAKGKATVVVKKGSKRVLKKTIKVKKGRATMKLPKLTKGTWKVTVKYRGSATISKAKSRTKIKVRR
ncbi:NPCBM-associated, NEW3 domain of alpha-galactosidase [Micrococcales bacterium KH10]|nr:NPCBM-associated, NEW3 domain of alpha-galactosidase [Micrococcales bacterium KH10]